MPRTLENGTVVVIPARFESSRFPGKPLAEIAGTSLIERVWQRVCLAVDAAHVIVATDDERIARHVDGFGGTTAMTSSAHLTGTDRCHEVAQQLGASLVINVQGDEPLVDPATILAVVDAAAAHPGITINAMSTIDDDADYRSPNVPKVVAAPDHRLLYMSRGPIPSNKELTLRAAWRQVCVYAFPAAALAAFTAVGGRTPLEAAEDIEILRLLELGLPVHMIEVAPGSVAVDVPGDVGRVEAILHG